MKIAVDGPVSSGKSTISKKVAQQNQLIYLDTGAMYRCVTLYMIQENVPLENEERVAQQLEKVHIHFEIDGDTQRVFLNNEDVSERIRQTDITRATSATISTYPSVRSEMVRRQQEYAKNHSIIMDGRDIGTVVLPEAELKIFLVASVEERARRRFEENKIRGIEQSFEELIEDIKQRDLTDSTRKQTPLKKAADAIEIDTTTLTIDQVVEQINQLIKERTLLSETTEIE